MTALGADVRGADVRDILLIAPPQGRRARAFQASLAQAGHPPARTVPYLALLRGEADLRDLVRPGTVVRLDSPGEDLDTERALIRLGGAEPGDLGAGELPPLRAWYAGLGAALSLIQTQLEGCPAHHAMQRPAQVLAMFDKVATHSRLQAAGISVPEALPEVSSADDVLDGARARGWSRLFVKPAYGSSACGAVALRWRGDRVSAVSTVHMEGGRLFNSKALRHYGTWPEVRALLEALAPQRLHAERWLPKAAVGGRAADLRLVVVGGAVTHALLRVSGGPITNLHLGNERGDLGAFVGALGPQRWAQVLATASAALATFPGALYAGVDVLLTPGLRCEAVLEVNAFGDYHRGVTGRGGVAAGLDTYQAELRALAVTAARGRPVQTGGERGHAQRP